MNEIDPTSVITPENLQALVQEVMPFGKYQSTLLADLPEVYLLWFNKQGFPKGRLGELLQLSLLLHIDGSRKILDPLRRPQQAPRQRKSTVMKFD
jgi:uncharacterized protein (DUF3820 family)